MPITVDALVLGLTAGVKSYDTAQLSFCPTDGNYGNTFSRHYVQIYGTSVINAQKLHTGPGKTDSVMTTPVTTGDAAPNFKVKSYLNAPVVCGVGTSGTVTKIAFALAHVSRSSDNQFLTTSETGQFTTDGNGFAAGGYCNAYASVPSAGLPDPSLGDVYMVITLSPGIAVTAGGYLTVKGYTGVGGSDSFTYVTLQSGS